MDVYRGFAMLGVFVVNFVIMNSTFRNQDEFAKPWTSDIDQISEYLLQLFFNTKWRKILMPLKYAGRMALTKYRMQRFIGLILFSSIGFRRYSTLSPSQP